MKRFGLFALELGTVVAVLGLGKVHAVLYRYDYTGSSRFGWSLAYVLLLIASAYGVGLPDLPRGRRGRLALGLIACSIAAGSISVVQLVAGDALLPRFVVFGSALGLVPWCVACAALCGNGTNRAGQRERVVVVGDLGEAKDLGEELLLNPDRPASLVDVVDVEAANYAADGDEPLTERVREDHASVLVLSRAAQDDERVISQAAAVHSSGVRVRSLVSFYDEWLGKIPVTELERMSLMFDIGELHRRHYQRVRRLVDLVFASAGLVVLIAVIPMVAAGNAFGNRGPLFYRQPRVGKGGDEFQLVKFRTMRPPAGSGSPNDWATPDDPRITRFGRALRRAHVDELPQVVNVIRGDLSIVGPRPEQPHYVRWLVERIPFYDMRHMVRPGLTGWAQVNYGYAGDERDAVEKLQYDFYYLRHQSLRLDVRIIARTIRSVVGFTGR